MSENDLSPEAAILTAMFSSHPATPAAPSPPTRPTSAPTLSPTLAPGSPQAEITSAQAEMMIGWEKDNLEKGRITAEEANRRFDALGATPEQRVPDTRSAEVKALDAAFPPARPQDFLIQWYPPRTRARRAAEGEASPRCQHQKMDGGHGIEP